MTRSPRVVHISPRVCDADSFLEALRVNRLSSLIAFRRFGAALVKSAKSSSLFRFRYDFDIRAECKTANNERNHIFLLIHESQYERIVLLHTARP